MIGAVVTTLAGFASLILVSRSYGQTATGVLFTAVGVFTLLANTAKIGTEASMTWFVAHARANGRRGAIAKVVSSALTGSALASVVVAVLAGLAAAPLATLLTDDPALGDDMRSLLVLLAVAIPGWAVAQASLGAMRGFGTMRPSVWVGAILRPGVQLVVLAGLVAQSTPLWVLGFAWLTAGLASAVAGLWWLARRIAPIPVAADDDGRSEFWGHARPRAASDILHGALERLDVILVGALAGSAAAGSYAAANRLVLAGQLVLMAIAQAIAPPVATHLAAGRNADAEVLVQRVTGWSVLLLWPAMAVMVAGAPGIMTVFGDDFADTAVVVAVLGVGLALVSAMGPGDAVLLMTGDSRGSMHNHVVALVAMVVVALAAIPPLGAVGAALAWVASRMTLRGLSVWRIQRATGIRSVGWSVALTAGLTVVAYGPVAIASYVAGVPDPATLALVAVLGSTAYLVGVWGLADDLEIASLATALRRSGPRPQ
jgi:O-antigen/teichoic acid export membrane protein